MLPLFSSLLRIRRATLAEEPRRLTLLMKKLSLIDVGGSRGREWWRQRGGCVNGVAERTACEERESGRTSVSL